MQDKKVPLDDFCTLFLLLRYDLSHDQRPHWGPHLLATPSRPPQRVETSWGSTRSRLASSALSMACFPMPSLQPTTGATGLGIKAGKLANRASFGAKPQQPGRAEASCVEPSPRGLWVLERHICRRRPTHQDGRKQSRTLPLRAKVRVQASWHGNGGWSQSNSRYTAAQRGRLPSKQPKEEGTFHPISTTENGSPGDQIRRPPIWNPAPSCIILFQVTQS
ncbi:hypothetical protein CORC01_08213 [Colletotrichum orchidophilum]|uniref:Uncharacterized protein n=1 Tax=Colletotrichum orchidophilum TaxID=1209926 RepID=A0A1G4B4T3_9PEZI|nr:uncharacterized protein CORC01_08213 [Colletotrichum orchidophilum]OHE96450.1 hypothetical protein CORC01_08213 [Colletotrichum orchidophilum]